MLGISLAIPDVAALATSSSGGGGGSGIATYFYLGF
jgi:hypothetical protein